MKKTLNTNHEAVENTKKGITLLAPELEKFTNEFNALYPGAINTLTELEQALGNPTMYFKNLILQQIPDQEYGLPVNKQERIKAVKMPDLSALTESSVCTKEVARQFALDRLESIYSLKNGKISINEAGVESYIEKHSLIIDEEDKAKAEFHAKHEAFVNSLNEFKNFCAETFGANNSDPLFNTNNFKINRFVDPYTLALNPNLMQDMFDTFPVLNK